MKLYKLWFLFRAVKLLLVNGGLGFPCGYKGCGLGYAKKMKSLLKITILYKICLKISLKSLLE